VSAPENIPSQLDFSGYKCPLPVLKARKAMHDAEPGSVFIIRVTDPKAPADFAEFCRVTGYTMRDVRPLAVGHELEIKI